MIRTQISLAQDDYDAAKAEAARLGISLAEFFRRALRGALPADDSQPWMRYAGMVESGNPASSLGIDDIVYGHKS
ncbi:MAG TPA: ribbon-helix-helix domain-containing protein [Thermoleophilia bacterium]|nr:ribbon-helix-helix domain-containing protein [Thermoleophilia bacterium]